MVPGTDETVMSSEEGRKDGISAFLARRSCFHLLFTHVLVSSLTVGYSFDLFLDKIIHEASKCAFNPERISLFSLGPR